MADSFNSDGICRKETKHSSYTNTAGYYSSGDLYWNTILLGPMSNVYVFFGMRASKTTASQVYDAWYPNANIKIYKNFSTSASFNFDMQSAYPHAICSYRNDDATENGRVHYFVGGGVSTSYYCYPQGSAPLGYHPWSAGLTTYTAAQMRSNSNFGVTTLSYSGTSCPAMRYSLGSCVQVKVTYTSVSTGGGNPTRLWIAAQGTPSGYHYDWSSPFSHEFIFGGGPRIWHNSAWHQTIPYVWHNSAWHACVAYVWHSSAWHTIA